MNSAVVFSFNFEFNFTLLCELKPLALMFTQDSSHNIDFEALFFLLKDEVMMLLLFLHI